jgi:CubicO group peptidase (beta-lactamase class C family)
MRKSRWLHASLIAAALYVLPPLTPSSFAQSAIDVTGRWNGAIDIPGSSLEVIVSLEKSGDHYGGSIDIPAQKAKALALAKVEVSGASVAFAIAGVPGEPTFRGALAGDRITGTFTQGAGTFPSSLRRQAPAGSAAPAEAATLDSIRAYLSGAIERWNVPGIGVAIVRDGRVLMAEGFGLRDREKKLPVTGATLMPIGSTTKSFTAFIIGTLVAEGKLEWDKPVVDYLPEFRLADEQHTQQMRVRDLLTHVSGLPRHDIVWYGSAMSRAELFSKLRYLEPSAPVRSTWQYQNLMYMTAGVLAEKVTGKTWETLLTERILAPLGMTSTTISLAELKTSADHAVGYESHGKKGLEAVEYRSAEAIGPAGAISSSAAEMARWLQLQIDKGEYQGKQLIDPAALAEIHAPQVVIGSGATGGEHLLFNLYAMGWMEHAYRGRRLIEHGGNIDGFSAVAGFLPGEKIGVVVLANRGGTPMPNAAMMTIFDRLLGENDYDWEGKGLTAIAELDSALEQSRALADDGLRVPNTRPSHELDDYAGEYEHPAYGVVTVRARKGRLSAELHGIEGTLEHYHYDVFRLTGGPEVLEGMLIEFRTSTTGEIASLVAPLEPAVKPIEFERRASRELSDPSVLERYVGDYAIAGRAVTVSRRDSTLYLTVSGQPQYELVAASPATFDLKGLTGYSVRFTPRNARAEQAIFIQPNGTFVAKRK